MAKKGKTKRSSSKIPLWYKHFTNESNRDTFLNKAGSARAAGYKAKNNQRFAEIGCQNSIKLKAQIAEWMDETGLSDEYLKGKLRCLVDAQKTIFQKIKGKPTEEQLTAGVQIVASTSSQVAGLEVDGETILSIPVEALEIQDRALDKALKVKGLYAPEVIDHNIKGLRELLDHIDGNSTGPSCQKD